MNVTLDQHIYSKQNIEPNLVHKGQMNTPSPRLIWIIPDGRHAGCCSLRRFDASAMCPLIDYPVPPRDSEKAHSNRIDFV